MKFLGLILGSMFVTFAIMAESNFGLEQLFGVSVDPSGLTFQVPSNGCTEKDHFEFQVIERLLPLGPMLPALEHHYYISVNRKTPDLCEDFHPYGTKISIGFHELGIPFGKFHVNNPIGGDKIITVP